LGLGAGLGLQTKNRFTKLTNGSKDQKDQFQQYHSSTHLQCQILNQFIKIKPKEKPQFIVKRAPLKLLRSMNMSFNEYATISTTIYLSFVDMLKRPFS
jgi:hypothetical protein